VESYNVPWLLHACECCQFVVADTVHFHPNVILPSPSFQEVCSPKFCMNFLFLSYIIKICNIIRTGYISLVTSNTKTFYFFVMYHWNCQKCWGKLQRVT
jgi:hypothetical protein